MTIEFINVHPRYRAMRAAQYTGQPDFPGVERCIKEKGKLVPLGEYEAFGPTEMGYHVKDDVFVPIRPGYWVIVPPDGLPLPEAIVMSDEDFQRSYAKE